MSDEPEEHALDRSLRTEWIVLWLLAAVPVAAIVVAVGTQVGAAGLVASLVLAAAIIAAVPLGTGAVWRRWRYVLWDDAIEVRHGVVRHGTTFVPFHRIQQVDVERGPLDRAFGIATLVLRTAAATTDAKIPGLDPTLVDGMRQRLLERAGVDDAV